MQKIGIKIPENYKYICAFLTMNCNLNCDFCLNAFNKSFNRTGFKQISGEEWVKALNKIESKPDVPITLSGGEPFMHKDFIHIINNLKPELNVDILTNLHWGEEGIKKFINNVDPKRIKRDSPYASIRVSYHPEQMNARKLVEDVKKLQDAGFDIGVWSVLYPSPEQLSKINQMQFICKEAGVEFRVKEFTGDYKGETYGDYSKYPRATNNNILKSCLCKTTELLIGPDGKVYRCHRDLYEEEFPVGNILNDNFQVEPVHRKCIKFGQCHPCDVKVKTNHKQQLGHTSVDIKDINEFP